MKKKTTTKANECRFFCYNKIIVQSEYGSHGEYFTITSILSEMFEIHAKYTNIFSTITCENKESEWVIRKMKRITQQTYVFIKMFILNSAKDKENDLNDFVIKPHTFSEERKKMGTIK